MTDPEHVLNWGRDREGKGFILPDDTVYNWKTNRGNPSHADMGFNAHPGAVRIMIAPDGQAEVHADPDLRRGLERAVMRADRRLWVAP